MPTTISCITEQRMALEFHMRADLVGATGLEAEAQKSSVFERLFNMIGGDCGLATVPNNGNPLPVPRMPGKWCINNAIT